KFPELMHSIPNIRKTIMSDGNLCYLVYHNKSLIAYLIGDFRNLPDNRYAYYISYLYVSPNYRNHKIGTKLMIMLLNKCQSTGTKFIALTCDSNNTKVVSFYKKFGFIKDPLLNSNKRHTVYCLFL